MQKPTGTLLRFAPAQNPFYVGTIIIFAGTILMHIHIYTCARITLHAYIYVFVRAPRPRKLDGIFFFLYKKKGETNSCSLSPSD